MDPKIAVFEAICWVVLASITAYFATRSVKDGKIHPAIWLTLAIFSISWMESPYDRAMFVQFNPDFHRLPAWGPLAATQGGLPVMAPAGYVMYFVMPALLAVAIADWIILRRGLRRGPTLVVVGIVVGVSFDALMQFGQSQLASLWVFSRTAPYVTAFPGSLHQIPLYDLLAMGSMIMWVTYLLGSRDPHGDTFIELWANRSSSGTARRLGLTAFGYVGLMHVLYLFVLLPHLILWWGQMLTQTGVLQPFAQIHVQPAGPQSNGGAGAVLIMVWLAAGIAITYVVAWRRSAHRQSLTHPPGRDRRSPGTQAVPVTGRG